MKLHVLSDLHLDMGAWDWASLPKEGEADVCVVAGDLANKRRAAVDWLGEYSRRSGGRPIVLVLGNHDYYDSTLRATLEFWRACELVTSKKVLLLENESVVVGGVEFVGCTYWTDMDGGDEWTMQTALHGLNDYRLIKREATKMRGGQEYKIKMPLHPRDTMHEHNWSVRYLTDFVRTRESDQMTLCDDRANLKKDFETMCDVKDKTGVVPGEESKLESKGDLLMPTPGLSAERKDDVTKTKMRFPLIVITHHLPSYKSVDPVYKDSTLNACFASHTCALVQHVSPILWIHGHTHASCDYMIGKTRVVCNPRGYGTENSFFNPRLVLVVHEKEI